MNEKKRQFFEPDLCMECTYSESDKAYLCKTCEQSQRQQVLAESSPTSLLSASDFNKND